MPGAAVSQVAGATLPGHERDRGLRAGLAGLHRASQRLGEFDALADRLGEGVASRHEGVEHRLVAGLRLPASLHSAHRGSQRLEPRLRIDLGHPTGGDAEL